MEGIRKRIIAIVLLLAMCTALFVGCGKSKDAEKSSSDQPATTDNTEKEKETETDTATDTTPSGEKITITFPSIWVGTDSKAKVFGEMVTSFNKENEGKIEVVIEENTDYDMYNDKIRTTISTGKAPDIFTCKSYADMVLYSQSGKLMDLTPYFDDGWKDRFLDGFVEGAKVDGKNFSVPYETQTIPIMFNTKLLNAAGITTVPTTYDELWAACEALKAQGIYPTTQMTNNNAWTSMLWYTYALLAAGGPDVYKNGLDDPAFIEAAKIMQQMFQYTSPDAVGADATVVNGHFFNERAAVYTNGSWILARIKSEGVEGLIDNVVVSGSLSYNGGDKGAYINGVQAYMFAGKQDDPAKEEAIVKFMKYISEPERIAALSASSGATFAVKNELPADADPLFAEIIKQASAAPYAIGSFEASMPTGVTLALPAALDSLVLGEYTPEEFVQALKDANQ